LNDGIKYIGDDSIECPSLVKYEFYRRSYVGGIVDYNARCVISSELSGVNVDRSILEEILIPSNSSIHYYDINSSYPTAMLNCKFPIGPSISTSSYMQGKFGVYEVEVSNNNGSDSIPFIYYKSSGSILGLCGGSSKVMVLISNDIEFGLRNNHSIRVLSGYYWDKCENIFSGYIND